MFLSCKIPNVFYEKLLRSFHQPVRASCNKSLGCTLTIIATFAVTTTLATAFLARGLFGASAIAALATVALKIFRYKQ